MGRGLLIALEGIDGAGTTSQLKRLGHYFAQQRYSVHLTCEPAENPIGRLLRDGLAGREPFNEETLALLFAADRLCHLERDIEPQLHRGAVVITDRYLVSSLAYQSTHLPLAWVASINARARRPDISFFLRVSVATAKARRAARGGDHEKFDDDARQQRVAAAYESIFATAADIGAWQLIDAEQPLEAVTADLARRVDALMKALPPEAAPQPRAAS